MGIVDSQFDQSLKTEEKATDTLAGGLMMNGYQCGMLWGAALAAGARAHQQMGPGPQAETQAILASAQCVDAFRTPTRGEINCLEIVELNLREKNQAREFLKFFIKGKVINCFRMAARYAPQAYETVDTAFSRPPAALPAEPVSCTAMLARRMGASQLHTTMAAGLAGGIGLSGGACGALGAAIWIIGMNGSRDGVDSKTINDGINTTIERFLKSSDYQFECSEIVGRKFESPADHAAHLCQGGCGQIIEALAAG